MVPGPARPAWGGVCDFSLEPSVVDAIPGIAEAIDALDAPAHVVIWNAAIQRFRPILLTTVTTFGGLAPMIFETSRQARIMIPMAVSLGYGILFATAITLLIVPCLYLIVEDVKNVFLSLPARAARRQRGVPEVAA